MTSQETATRQLTEMQSAFVHHLIETGDATTAARLAGFSEATQGSRVLRIPHVLAAVKTAVGLALAEDAPLARNLLRRYVQDETAHPKIRLDAAKTLLDRSGHVAPKAKDDSVDRAKALNEMSTEELRATADRLANEIANRARPVLGASEAPIETEDGSID